MITSGCLQGHWVRRWIKAPGFEDHDTRVHWMQAGLDYADIRIPAAQPDLGKATCLADLPAGALLDLARAEGFAGHVTLADETCTWHREVNWHGTPDSPDVGAISFDDDGQMIEAGVLAEYTELWAQNASATARTIARRFGNGVYSGLLVASGDVAVLGIGQTGKPASRPVLDALEDGEIPKDISMFFDGLHALCRITGETVTATLATDPFAEGKPVLSFDGPKVVWHRTGFDGIRADVELQAGTRPA